MPATLSPILKQATAVQVATGRGAVLTDIHGREYLDFTAGIGVTTANVIIAEVGLDMTRFPTAAQLAS